MVFLHTHLVSHGVLAQVAAYLLARAQAGELVPGADGPALILCPATMVAHWLRELQVLFMDERTMMVLIWLQELQVSSCCYEKTPEENTRHDISQGSTPSETTDKKDQYRCSEHI